MGPREAITIDSCCMMSLFCMAKLFDDRQRMIFLGALRDRLIDQEFNADEIDSALAELNTAMEEFEKAINE